MLCYNQYLYYLCLSTAETVELLFYTTPFFIPYTDPVGAGYTT